MICPFCNQSVPGTVLACHEVGRRFVQPKDYPDDFGVWDREGQLWLYSVGIKGEDFAQPIGRDWGELGTPVRLCDLPFGGWRPVVPASEALEP